MGRIVSSARKAGLVGLLLSSAWLLALSGCERSQQAAILDEEPPELLSAFGLFEGAARLQQPAAGVIPFDLNSPLFSDYASKYRFVKLPAGQAAKYNASRVFDFPVGTVIAKTFALPHDMNDKTRGERILETRILRHQATGWVALPYVWNDEQTDARLALAGAVLNTSWIHRDGTRHQNEYLVPNVNQCKNCHKEAGDKLAPIGPKARHLNRDFVYHEQNGQRTENQLVHWARHGALTGAPDDPAKAPRLAVWNDPNSGTLDQRARGWLEINCAHCHNPSGHARNAGLDLTASQTQPFQYGVFKPPVAAGQGSGGLLYDIVPGNPDQSILAFRIASTHPDVMMPELGRRLVHAEGVALIRQWIAALPSPRANP